MALSRVQHLSLCFNFLLLLTNCLELACCLELRVILKKNPFSGDKSTVLSSKSFEKAVLEIPHQVHDVVSKT